MPYPPAPWTLKGHSLQTLGFVDIAKARPLVPAELDIVSVLPGKTLGGVYVAHYGEQSTLVYNELIVVAALTRYGGKVGSWISHIYVDNPDSVAGGREIWGLPKELAQFTWEQSNHGGVTVQQGEQPLCTLQSAWTLPLWRQGLAVNSFSALRENLLQFRGQTAAKLAVVGASLEVPADSPLVSLEMTRPLVAVKSTKLELVAGAPQVVGQRKIFATRVE